jgi:hypothetical protein
MQAGSGSQNSSLPTRKRVRRGRRFRLWGLCLFFLLFE